MELEPSKTDFTIYSKCGCSNCVKSKKYLNSINIPYLVIECDEHLVEDRAGFLIFMTKLAKKEVKQFPIIFHCGKYVGGYNELKTYIDSQSLFTDVNDF